jgi:NADH-quinone oxidoreductase subunit F
MLGSGGVIVLDDRRTWCGRSRGSRASTPTRAARSARSAARARRGRRDPRAHRDGQGTAQDLDTLLSIADNMTGKTICVLSDSCATPVVSGLKKFRHEFEAKLRASPNVVSFAGAQAARGGASMAARVAASLDR